MIPYLTGGERPTADRMNLLVDAIEGKMEKILLGRSFVWAQASHEEKLPRHMVGACFYFCPGNTATPMSNCFPDFTAVTVWDALPIAGEELFGKPYDHDYYTALVAAHTADPSKLVSVDHEFKVANFEPIVESTPPAGSPPRWHLGNSLEAHTFTSPATNNEPYYCRFNFGFIAPTGATYEPSQKKYDFAVAEIICEGGTTDWTLDPTWTKYSCFRIHNLNVLNSLTVSAGNLNFTIPPMQCRCIRRDPRVDMDEFTLDGKYFWRYRPGDPRFFWWLHEGQADGLGAAANLASASMRANNLSNPQIFHDWVNHFSHPSRLACWLEDKSEQVDVNSAHADLFGDPSDDDTLVGDLFHHRGELILVKVYDEPAPEPPAGVIIPYTAYREEFVRFQFNGYETIVDDFAAVGLTVSTNVSGDLQIAWGGPAMRNVDLITVSTNLLKQGDVVPGTVPLVVNSVSTPYTLEHAIFEVGRTEEPYSDNRGPRPVIGDEPPQRIFRINDRLRTETTRWFDERLVWNSGLGAYTNPDPSGNDQQYDGMPGLYYSQRGSVGAIHGIHALTVAELKELALYGDPDLGVDQNGQPDYQDYGGVSLILTPSGPVLLFQENIKPASEESFLLPGVNNPTYFAEGQIGLSHPIKLIGASNYTTTPRRWIEVMELGATPTSLDGLTAGKVTRNRSIKFRGHGWSEGSIGGWNRAGVRLPGKPFMLSGLYDGVEVNRDGADLDWRQLPGDGSQLSFSLLSLIDERPWFSGITHDSGVYFMPTALTEFNTAVSNTTRVDAPMRPKFMIAADAVAKSTAEPWLGYWNAQGRSDASGFHNGLFFPPPGLALPLCAEHYNSLAREINSRKVGQPLPLHSIRIWAPLAKEVVQLSLADPTFPMPLDLLTYFGEGSAEEEVFMALGADILTIDDFPESWVNEMPASDEQQGIRIPTTTRFEREIAEVHVESTTSGMPITHRYDLQDRTVKTLGEIELIGSRTSLGSAGEAYGPKPTPAGSPGPEVGSYNLNDHAGIRWVSISDVAAILESLTIDAAIQQVYRPLSLRRLDLAGLEGPFFDYHYQRQSFTALGSFTANGGVNTESSASTPIGHTQLGVVFPVAGVDISWEDYIATYYTLYEYITGSFDTTLRPFSGTITYSDPSPPLIVPPSGWVVYWSLNPLAAGHVSASESSSNLDTNLRVSELCFIDDPAGDFKIAPYRLQSRSNRAPGESTLRASLNLDSSSLTTSLPFDLDGDGGGIIRGESDGFDDDSHNARYIAVVAASGDLDLWHRVRLGELQNIAVLHVGSLTTGLTFIPNPYDHWGLVNDEAAWKETVDTAFKRYPNPVGPGYPDGIGSGHGGTAPTVKTGGTTRRQVITGSGVTVIEPEADEDCFVLVDAPGFISL